MTEVWMMTGKMKDERHEKSVIKVILEKEREKKNVNKSKPV